MRFSRRKPAEAEPEIPQAAEEPDEKNEAASAAGKPACPNCGWHSVRPSLTKGPFDRILSTMSFRAFRCRTCGHRFHIFRRSGGN